MTDDLMSAYAVKTPSVARPKPSEKQRRTSAQLPKRWVRYIDTQVRKALNKQKPKAGAKWNRSDILREAIEKGLAIMSDELGIGPMPDVGPEDEILPDDQ